MRTLSLIGIAVLLCMLTTAAFAYPNLQAATGIVGLPNAYIAPTTPAVAADVLFFNSAAVNVRALTGIGNDFEVGVFSTIGTNTGLGVSAKYLTPIKWFRANWALGGNLVGGTEQESGGNLYFVATRPFGVNANCSSGFWGTIGLLYTSLGTNTVSPFLGAQWAIARRTELDAEYGFQTVSDTNALASVALRYLFSPQFVGEIGFTNSNGFTTNGHNDNDSNSHKFFLGGSYTFGGNPR